MWEKIDVLESVCDEERRFFFEIKEGHKVCRVKILIFWYLTERSVFILNIA